ncbi:MAG: hypothetical protein HRT35_20410 [Algicola sp.]|nr:hypothetical protein [Algicola sp.]
MNWQKTTWETPISITIANDRATLAALAAQHVDVLIVTPYTQGVGDGKTLSLPNAVASMADKFTDLKNQPSGWSCVVVAITAKTEQDFSQKISDFVDAGGPSLIAQTGDRAGYFAALETEKWTINTAHQVPAFWRGHHNLLPGIAEHYRAKSVEMAINDGLTAVGNIADELAALNTRKQNRRGPTVEQASAEVLGVMIDASTPDAAKPALLGAGGPGHEMTYTALIAFAGDVELIQQWCGL